MLVNPVGLSTLFRADRRAVSMQRQLQTDSPNRRAQLGNTSDPYSAQPSHKISLDREPFLVYGRIVDCIAYTKFYKVQLDRGAGVISACDLVHTSLEVTGAKQINTYLPGTGVWIMWHPHMPFGLILGAMPDFMLSPLDAMSDYIAFGSRVGLNVDAIHKYPFQLKMGGGIVDWSAGRPFDSIPAGEWGAITDTGLMVFLDSCMALIRVDEETGMSLFYDDQLARFQGHNMQLRSAGYDREDHDDEEEFNIVEACTPYLWEARGGFDRDAELSRTYSNEDAQLNQPWYANLEPADDHQQAIHRYRKFLGYMGQGYKRTLFILPEGQTDIQKMDDRTNFPGVAEEQWGLDGMISYRSAKGIIIAKRALIPMPKRIKLDEDTSGDTAANYKADGVYGDGPTPHVGDIRDPSDSHTSNLMHAAAFLDLYADVFNWRGLHQFQYHTKDWYMPQDTDYPFADEMARGNPPFGVLDTGYGMMAPAPIVMKVDDRYGQVAYFPNDSYIAMLDEGGILIGDGYGSELRLTAGNIYITAPGDIYSLSGKHCVSWAGRDWVARANFGAQLVANKCNVHIKANNKVEILGGNTTCGGVLIESKAEGVTFEAATPCADPALGEVSQTGGYRNNLFATINTSGYTPPKLKEAYTIRCTTPGGSGTAILTFRSQSGTDNGTVSANIGSPVAIGAKGLTITFGGSDDFVENQEWVAWVSKDPNDLNDETVGGVVIRAKQSAVVTYGQHIVQLLVDDGNQGTMVHDCGSKGTFMQHAKDIERHIENKAIDLFWTLGVPEVTINSESTESTTNASSYYGPAVTYTITCICGNTNGPLSNARVSVTSSLDDSYDSVVVNGSGLTAIGNRGFMWGSGLSPISVGDSWSYTINQTAQSLGIEYSANYIQFNQPLIVNSGVFVNGCVLASDTLTGINGVAASGYRITVGSDTTEDDRQKADADTRKSALDTWATDARTSLTQLKDSTALTKVEFFFPSSYQVDAEAAWRLFESHWQQMDRKQAGAAVGWTESAITGADMVVSVTSYPWPGKWSWTEYEGYFTEDVNMFKLSDNQNVDRPYPSPVYDTPASAIFDGNWKVIKNPCES